MYTWNIYIYFIYTDVKLYLPHMMHLNVSRVVFWSWNQSLLCQEVNAEVAEASKGEGVLSKSKSHPSNKTVDQYQSGQIIATLHDRFPPKGGLVRKIHLFQGNLGWWNIIIWPDQLIQCNKLICGLIHQLVQLGSKANTVAIQAMNQSMHQSIKSVKSINQSNQSNPSINQPNT